MSYKAIYLPTAHQVWIDGCHYINQNGEVFIYDVADTMGTHWMVNHQVAELMIVDMQFNKMVIIGRPSPGAKWLTNGMDVKVSDVADPNVKCEDDIALINVRCPTCRELH